MSTRWYPLYCKGAPQLRVFLPNFWLKLVRPTHDQPEDILQFQCSMEMTKYDIKNYLEKIYNLNIVNIRTRIALGETKKNPGRGYIVKDDDIKYAYVVLDKEQKFEFPNLFPKLKSEEDDYEKSIKQVKENYSQFLSKNEERVGLPGWFTL